MPRDEEQVRSRTSTHVSRASHGTGGGHHAITRTLYRRDVNDLSQPTGDDDDMSCEYNEYPKWVDAPGGRIKVRSPEEEAVATAGETVVREDDERARLYKVCQVKGVKADKRWGVDKLTAAIVDAGFDPDLDPDA